MAEPGQMEIKPVEGAPEPQPAAAEGQEGSDSITLIAYGKDTKLQAQVTGAEGDRLVELAQKGLASDERWREAQELTQRAKEDTDRAAAGIKVLDAADRLRENSNDLDAFHLVADALGYSEEAKAAALAQGREGEPKPSGKAPNPNLLLTDDQKWNNLPKDVKAQLKQGFRDRQTADLKVALANDAVLGDNEVSESRSAAILEMATDEAARLMTVGVPDSANGRNRALAYGPEVVRRAVETVRQRIESLGIHQDVSDQPPGGPGAGRAPTGGKPRHATSKPTRVPITHPDHAKYFQERLQWESLHGGK